MFRTLKNSHNVEDLRLLAKQRLPGPIFHYIDGAADDNVADTSTGNMYGTDGGTIEGAPHTPQWCPHSAAGML